MNQNFWLALFKIPPFPQLSRICGYKGGIIQRWHSTNWEQTLMIKTIEKEKKQTCLLQFFPNTLMNEDVDSNCFLPCPSSRESLNWVKK